VVIVTDRPGCIEKTLAAEQLLGPEKSRSEDVDIFHRRSEEEGQVHIVKRQVSKGNIVKIRLEKARAYQNIHKAGLDHHVSTIIYTDVDFVFGKDINTFVGNMHHMEKAKQHLLALFQEEIPWANGTKSGSEPFYHTSFMVMFAGSRTEKCLSEWGEWFKTQNNKDATEGPVEATEFADSENLGPREVESMEPESKALVNQLSCKVRKIRILPRTNLWLPTDEGMKLGKTAEFIHFTNAERWPGATEIVDRTPVYSREDFSEKARESRRIAATRSEWHKTTKQYLQKIGVPGVSLVDPFGITDSGHCSVKKSNTMKGVVIEPTAKPKPAKKTVAPGHFVAKEAPPMPSEDELLKRRNRREDSSSDKVTHSRHKKNGFLDDEFDPKSLEDDDEEFVI